MVKKEEQIVIPQGQLSKVDLILSSALMQLENSLNITAPVVTTPDHILAARHDASITFIENLLNAVSVPNEEITTENVIQTANTIIKQFSSDHPNDFDLNNPLDLIRNAISLCLPLAILYKSKLSEEDKTIFYLVKQVDQLLDETAQTLLPDEN